MSKWKNYPFISPPYRMNGTKIKKIAVSLVLREEKKNCIYIYIYKMKKVLSSAVCTRRRRCRAKSYFESAGPYRRRRPTISKQKSVLVVPGEIEYSLYYYYYYYVLAEVTQTI